MSERDSSAAGLVAEPIADLSARLRRLTPARVGLARAGVSLETADLLDFQLAHARARDAVHARMDAAAMARAMGAVAGSESLVLRSAAGDRRTYLQRPDMGRRLEEASRLRLEAFEDAKGRDLALVVADGLSAIAAERQAPGLTAELMRLLRDDDQDWRPAPVAVVEQGRVAIGDEIGEALGAKLVLVLIGERPGLSSPDSLGAYITWHPRVGLTDADRNCVSNIRPEGLGLEQAAARIFFYLREARRRGLTGVALKEGVTPAELGPSQAAANPTMEVLGEGGP